MAGANYEFGRVASLKADAVGEPGSRRFRLLARSRAGHLATLWMEKENLFSLGVAVKRIIAAVEQSGQAATSGRGQVEGQAEPPSGPGGAVEFQVGNLAVGYDRRTSLFTIVADEQQQEGSERQASSVTLHATLQEIGALADEAFRVCAAGRPTCRLCGSPLEPGGHICPALNGHATAVM